MRAVIAAMIALACGGDPTPRTDPAHARARDEQRAAQPAPEEVEEVVSPEAADGPGFDEPMPDEACPTVRVRLAHRSAEGLPSLLTQAFAFRSEDGRHVRVVLSDHEVVLDSLGRAADPAEGQARLELDAIRSRRGPLEPGPLGAPDAPRGGVTHVRVVSAGPIFTFGHRDIGGRVELTEVGAERVCGRVDLDDGFGRVRGAFTAAVRGPLPD